MFLMTKTRASKRTTSSDQQAYDQQAYDQQQETQYTAEETAAWEAQQQQAQQSGLPEGWYEAYMKMGTPTTTMRPQGSQVGNGL